MALSTTGKGCPTISEFFAGKSVFITGGSGFLGKVLIERLLRSCPNIREVIILMRPKKNRSIDERIRQTFALQLFDRLRQENPSAFEKVIPVAGDSAVEGLGISSVERQFLQDRVSVIFHVAANVKFDDTLKNAIFVNTRSTRDICILAQGMRNLVALVHVSSTYAHSEKPYVDEVMYPPDMDWKKIVKIAENVDDGILRTLTAKFLGEAPNTYVFTKRLAEYIIADYSKVLPCVLYRPSIVVSSLKEPMPGWIENFNGPVGLMIGGGKGLLQIVLGDPHTSPDYVPVDIAIQGVIAAAWKRGIRTITQDPEPHVYNCATNKLRCISIQDMVNQSLKAAEKTPLDGVLWLPQTRITASWTLYYIMVLLLHMLPAVIFDAILKVSGKRPMVVQLHRKIYASNCTLRFFITRQWTFEIQKFMDLLENLLPEDVNFGIDYMNFNMSSYIKATVLGGKMYLLHEDMNNLPKAIRHCRRMWWVDRIFKTWLVTVAMWTFYSCGGLSYVGELLGCSMH